MEAAVRQELPMILVRVIVGLVFLMEGIFKFLLPAELGAGYFAAIGLPFPQLLAPAVGAIEIIGGAFILLSFYAGEAALSLLAVAIAALIATKLPILLGHPLGPFYPIKLLHYGWLSFLHEARIDLVMLMSTLAVVVDSGFQVGNSRRWYQSR
jgi:uncharacterized membrane protein YphA (DoxX/SURF4 family)